MKAPVSGVALRSATRWRVAVLGWTLIWLSVFVFGWLGYQLWGTGIQNAQAQATLEQSLSERLVSFAPLGAESDSTADTESAEPEPPTTDAAPTTELLEEPPADVGEPIGRILIPQANVEDVLVEGVDSESLKKGPGHMPWTPLPGQPGNAVISGHRTTYGAPFFDLDLLEVDDEIHVDTLIGRHTYRVREVLIVDPTDVWVTEPRAGAWLTLTTCAPKYSAAQRLIVFAELVDGPNLAFVEATVGDDPGA